MPARSQAEAEAEVRSWGFGHVFTWTDSPNAHYTPHSHRNPTTHLILRGQLAIAYPSASAPASASASASAPQAPGGEPGRTTHGAGERVDVGAGVVHEVWIGPEGCTYVIGE